MVTQVIKFNLNAKRLFLKFDFNFGYFMIILQSNYLFDITGIIRFALHQENYHRVVSCFLLVQRLICIINQSIVFINYHFYRYFNFQLMLFQKLYL